MLARIKQFLYPTALIFWIFFGAIIFQVLTLIFGGLLPNFFAYPAFISELLLYFLGSIVPSIWVILPLYFVLLYIVSATASHIPVRAWIGLILIALVMSAALYGYYHQDDQPYSLLAVDEHY